MALKAVIKGLVKKFPKFTLSIDSLELVEGLHVLVGPNGSGKTVFLKLLTGVMRPSKGSIIYNLNGENVPSSRILPYAALVSTDVVLPNWKVRDLLEIYAGDEDPEDVAESFMIKEFLNKKYYDLSSGYKKRVQIAIAMSLPVRVLLLDEPFINVDSQYVNFLEEKILNITGKLVVVASHIPTRLLEHDIIFINNGRILFSGKIPGIVKKLVEIETEKGGITLDDALTICGMDGEIRIRSLQEVILEYSKTVSIS